MKSDVVFGLENAGWPVLLLNSTLQIERANSIAARLLGLAPQPEEPALASIWSLQNGTTADKFFDAWERSPTPTTRVKLGAKDGDLVSFPISICTFFNGGEKFFLLQFLPEVLPPLAGERPPGADAGAAHKQKLDCALQLARTIALDFNNALTSILGHTSLVLSKMEPGNPWRGSLLEVEKSAAKAAEIANDLGAFSRQEKEPRAQSSGNLNAVLQRTLDFFQKNPQPAQVQWTVLFERKLFTAKFDEAKMQQAFVKILENAVQALSGSGRITLQTRNVELAERTQDRNVPLAPGAYVSAEITDTGGGIEPEVLPRIFEPFFTTKIAPHRGLGLAWVYGIVTNHGGGVAVSSQPGIGTSVRVYLPAESRVIRDSASESPDLRGTQTVLMVDDEDLVLTMGKTILSAYGYGVLTANSGQKALDLLTREKKIDLIITDLVMPSMSGRELVEHINRQWPDIPVLCTSGYIWQGAQETDTAYLQKPFTSHHLLLKVKNLLNSADS
jgi:two-component system, cell cycle sensor histidine kinase and response regulator CckA